MSTDTKLPTYFLSHGGGPWPWMKEEMGNANDALEKSLQDIPRQLGRAPTAILMISAHWIEKDFTVMTHAKPPMIYDYRGFPERTYRVRYGAPGSPDLAARVQTLVAAAGFATAVDQARGFDHGAFVPLAMIYPRADIPVVQLSIRRDFDPEAHFMLGRALAALRADGVLILGSGLSYHNLAKFGPSGAIASRAFDHWLQQVLLQPDLKLRRDQLLDWGAAPSARDAHPREDHLIPLMVALGAAEDDVATVVYHEDAYMGGCAVSSFRFGSGV